MTATGTAAPLRVPPPWLLVLAPTLLLPPKPAMVGARDVSGVGDVGVVDGGVNVDIALVGTRVRSGDVGATLDGWPTDVVESDVPVRGGGGTAGLVAVLGIVVGAKVEVTVVVELEPVADVGCTVGCWVGIAEVGCTIGCGVEIADAGCTVGCAGGVADVG